MKYKETTYHFSFETVLRGGPKQLFLHFPGKYGGSYGPFPSRDAAWERFIRILRQCYFLTGPFKESQQHYYEEWLPVPESLVWEWKGHYQI